MWPLVISTETRLVRSRRPLPQDPCTGVAALCSAVMACSEPSGLAGGLGGAAGSTATDSQSWPMTVGAGPSVTACAADEDTTGTAAASTGLAPDTDTLLP